MPTLLPGVRTNSPAVTPYPPDPGLAGPAAAELSPPEGPPAPSRPPRLKRGWSRRPRTRGRSPGVRAQHPHHRLGDVLGDQFFWRRLLVAPRPAGEVRQHLARVAEHHPHVVAPEFVSPALCHPPQGELAGGVGRPPPEALGPGGGGDIHDGARALLHHLARGGAAHQKGPQHVGPPDALHVVHRGLQQRSEAPEAGVVDQDVDAPRRLDQRVDHALGVRLDAHIPLDGRHAQLAGHALQRLRVPPADRDGHAEVHQRARDGQADAAAPAGHEGALSFQCVAVRHGLSFIFAGAAWGASWGGPRGRPPANRALDNACAGPCARGGRRPSRSSRGRR